MLDVKFFIFLFEVSDGVIRLDCFTSGQFNLSNFFLARSWLASLSKHSQRTISQRLQISFGTFFEFRKAAQNKS